MNVFFTKSSMILHNKWLWTFDIFYTRSRYNDVSVSVEAPWKSILMIYITGFMGYWYTNAIFDELGTAPFHVQDSPSVCPDCAQFFTSYQCVFEFVYCTGHLLLLLFLAEVVPGWLVQMRWQLKRKQSLVWSHSRGITSPDRLFVLYFLPSLGIRET